MILPAFGVTVQMLQQLERRGCTLIDTTCGSVLNVWKNVRRYCEGGYTSIIHGKAWHEETQATASQAVGYGGRYLVVFDHEEAQIVCDYIRGDGDRDAFLARFSKAASDGFDPDRDLCRIGLANQTTMLMSESLEIGEMLKAAMLVRYGAPALPAHFQAFDTICSATQDRQDAVVALLERQPVDLMLVIGGYNSSNTCNLARICAASRPTFHIADPDVPGLRDRDPPSAGRRRTPRSRPTGGCPKTGPISLGLTSGASTPDNLVGAAVDRLDRVHRQAIKKPINRKADPVVFPCVTAFFQEVTHEADRVWPGAGDRSSDGAGGSGSSLKPDFRGGKTRRSSRN